MCLISIFFVPADIIDRERILKVFIVLCLWCDYVCVGSGS